MGDIEQKCRGICDDDNIEITQKTFVPLVQACKNFAEILKLAVIDSGESPARIAKGAGIDFEAFQQYLEGKSSPDRREVVNLIEELSLDDDIGKRFDFLARRDYSKFLSNDLLVITPKSLKQLWIDAKLPVTEIEKTELSSPALMKPLQAKSLDPEALLLIKSVIAILIKNLQTGTRSTIFTVAKRADIDIETILQMQNGTEPRLPDVVKLIAAQQWPPRSRLELICSLSELYR